MTFFINNLGRMYSFIIDSLVNSEMHALLCGVSDELQDWCTTIMGCKSTGGLYALIICIVWCKIENSSSLAPL